MLVYGDPCFRASFLELVDQLRKRLVCCQQLRGDAALDGLRTLVIQAGQLEQAVHDGSPGLLPRGEARELIGLVESLTDHAATAFVRHRCETRSGWGGGEIPDALAAMSRGLDALSGSEDLRLTVKTPEGFAFYSLYPEQYIEATDRWLADRDGAGCGAVLVIGIRSIGTTLSAVVRAALAVRGSRAHRITVRPSGHPFDRRVDIDRADLREAAFAIIVDEGPGLSGSSMAAAAKALSALGFDGDRIAFFPAHGRGPGQQASDETRCRWSTTRSYVVPGSELRWWGRALPDALAVLTPVVTGRDTLVESVEDLSAGGWRRAVYGGDVGWPAACTPFETTKYRCVREGGAVLWKFAGVSCGRDGRTGAEAVVARLNELSEQGWTERPFGVAHGFVAMPWIEGTPLDRREASIPLLNRIAGYVARTQGSPLPADEQAAAIERLAKMLYWNTHEAAGPAAADLTRAWSDAARRLACGLTIASCGDSHLAPYEWVRTPLGRIMKVDAGHELDHTLVGAQPVCWALAAIIIEWSLAGTVADGFVSAACQAGVPPIAPELLTFYQLAYSAFRLGICTLSAEIVTYDPAEQTRLRSAADWYRSTLTRTLHAKESP